MKKQLSVGREVPKGAIHFNSTNRLEHAAFALIELIVVIAALSLMVLVAVPTITRAEDYGKRAACWSNLRRLGMAVKMYASDNRDYLPFPNWGTQYKGWLFTPKNGAPPIGTTNDYEGGLLFPYTRDWRIYSCDSDRESPYLHRRANTMSSYVMNGAVSGFDSTPLTCKISSIWSSEAYLMWHPDESLSLGPFAFNDASADPTSRLEGLGRLHSAQGGEVVTVTGGVIFVPARQFLRAQQSPERSLVSWYPGR